MKKNLVILFLIVLTIINVAALATIAYHRLHPKRHFPPRGGPDMHEAFIKHELGLNEEQIKEFESQDKRYREETKPILDSLRAKRGELQKGIAAEEPNLRKLDKLTEEIGVFDVTVKKKTTMHLLNMKSLLTPEQRKKFFSLFKEGRDRMRGWRDREKGIGGRPRHPNFEEGK